MIKKYIYISILLGMFISPLSFGTVIPFDVSFDEIGDDVKVTLSLRDLNNQAFLNPPDSFWIQLYEDDIIFDDLLGMFEIDYSDLSITALSGGGYQSGSFMHTFADASNAFTGFGDDYILDVTAHVPEPTTVAIFSLALAGLGFTRRKKM